MTRDKMIRMLYDKAQMPSPNLDKESDRKKLNFTQLTISRILLGESVFFITFCLNEEIYAISFLAMV